MEERVEPLLIKHGVQVSHDESSNANCRHPDHRVRTRGLHRIEPAGTDNLYVGSRCDERLLMNTP